MFECQKRLLHYPSINIRASMLPRSLFLYIECSTVNGTLGVYEIVDSENLRIYLMNTDIK